MKNHRDSLWFPKLVPWKNWEIPKPGAESLVGFGVVMAVSLLLHGFVLWLCSLFRHF